MNYFSTTLKLLTCLITIVFSNFILAQDHKTTVNQNEKFEMLLIEKRKLNASTSQNDRYKIEIFNGDAESTKKALADFKKANKSIDASIAFFTPLYKVVVGNFKNRFEAEKSLIELKKTYKTAHIVKPKD